MRASGWRLLWFAPAACLMSAIWHFSSLSRLPQLPPGLDWDKLIHAGAYGLLAGLLWMGFAFGAGMDPRRAAVAGWIVAVAYGIVDEVHQAFVPVRQPDIRDAAADALGAALAASLAAMSARLFSAGGHPEGEEHAR